MNGINGLDSCQQLLSTSASRISNLEHIVYDDSLDIEVKTEPMPLQDHEFHQNDKNNSDEMSLQREILRELRKINQRLDNVEAILLGQGPHLDRTPAKPSILPLNTVEEVAAFNKIDDATKKAVVSYLGYLGGSNVRESANLCIKETLSGDCVSQFTWLGRDIGRRPIGTPFYNTKLSAVILEAISSNRSYPVPTKTEYASHMKEALRVAKQRNRNQLLSKKRRTTDDEEDS
ncbi:uncharacterized protein LOC117177936 isoform X2 [Belonocnema kinseyi]|uniref:uncharacterized protein LOC117177936 isoform X2 n=1 Tax=Belonocnema kinseyi TaxID=2817044 RepID=UPI00143D51B0|nr:uncharacterized protein LOC117177936 isoform X2 [Belonocnema kinseyi]